MMDREVQHEGGRGLVEARRSLAHALGRDSQVWICAANGMAALLQELGIPSDEVLRPLDGTPLALRDLRELAYEHHAQKRRLVVDISLPSPFGCAACRLGADVVLASLDCVVCHADSGVFMVGVGHGALQGDYGCGRLVDRVRSLPVPDHKCQADIVEGLAGYDARRRIQNDNAQVAAAYLACHPRVARLCYPGHKSDPSFSVAASTLVGGFGWVLELQPTDDSHLPKSADFYDLCGTWAPGGSASRLYQPEDSHGWWRLSCGTGSPIELVSALEACL